jgi:hypothetical protein
MTTRRSIALILSPVGLLFISTARLIIVSDYNTTTAVTIASSGGYINTLLGSVIPLIPIFIPYLALLLLLFRRFLLSALAFVFAAYITPSPISVTDAIALVRADGQQFIVQISNYRVAAIVLAVLVLLVIWGYQRSFAEGLIAVLAIALGLALLLAVPSRHLARPLRLASMNEYRLAAHLPPGLYLNGFHVWLLISLILFVLILWSIGANTNLPLILAWLLSVVVAVVATVAFLPYVYDIYPIPRHSYYYATVAHTMWLPTEKLVLSSGKIDYGYVLSSSSGWVTALSEPSRTIAYFPVADVVARSMCQPKTEEQLRYPQYPPLITTFYTPPPRIAPCTGHIRSTGIRAVRSQGEPLRTIASMVHVSAGRIISITNSYQHGRLSHALHHYEKVHNWKAPTPAGQRFWYYPSQIP